MVEVRPARLDRLEAIAEDRRAAALAAIASVTDPASVTGISQVTGGASKASSLRVDADRGTYLLQLEVVQRGFRNPKRTSPCVRAAAEAGIAPAVHHADEAAGVLLTDVVSNTRRRRSPAASRPSCARSARWPPGCRRRHRSLR